MHDDRLRPVRSALVGLSGSLLDVSCGRGELLGAAEGLGFKPVRGTEAVEYLCDGERVVRAEIHDLPFATASFDVVTCIDVSSTCLNRTSCRGCSSCSASPRARC